MKGRKPKPIEQHALEGTKPKNHTQVVVVGGRSLPDVPPTLTDEGEALWNTVTTDLGDSNILATGDRFAVEAAVVALMRAREARMLIDEDGLLVLKVRLDKDGNVISEEYIPHPALKIEKDALTLFLRYADHLGLSPAARARLGLTKVVGMTAAQLLNERLGANPLMQPPPGEVIELEATLDEDE